MSMVGFPLLLIPLAIYNIFVFLMPGVAFSAPIVSVTLMSRAQWTLTFGDALLALSMLLLWLEIVKASRPGARYLTDHLLSLVVFGVALAEFLMLGAFGTSTFFLLTVLMAVEFLAGASIGLRHRQQRAYAVPATPPAPVRQEPPMDLTPAAFESEAAEPAREPEKPTAAMRVEPKPPEMVTMTPAHEPAPPVPTLAVARASDTPAPVGERKISNWSVADLVRDEPEKTDIPPKP